MKFVTFKNVQLTEKKIIKIKNLKTFFRTV